MFETDANRIWKLLAKKLTDEATREDLLELKKLQGLYPEICHRAVLIMNWWYLDKIREQINSEREWNNEDES